MDNKNILAMLIVFSFHVSSMAMDKSIKTEIVNLRSVYGKEVAEHRKYCYECASGG